MLLNVSLGNLWWNMKFLSANIKIFFYYGPYARNYSSARNYSTFAYADDITLFSTRGNDLQLMMDKCANHNSYFCLWFVLWCTCITFSLTRRFNTYKIRRNKIKSPQIGPKRAHFADISYNILNRRISSILKLEISYFIHHKFPKWLLQDVISLDMKNTSWKVFVLWYCGTEYTVWEIVWLKSACFHTLNFTL